MQNIALPNQVFSSPYYGAQQNGGPPNQTYNTNHSYGSQQSPSYPNHQSPAYSPNNPYGSGSPYTPNNSYNSMNNPPLQQYAPPAQSAAPPQNAPTGTMGPPSRPAADKPTDINELGDVLAGSGVDLREEEAALLAYGRPGQQRQDTGYGASPFNSFGPSYSIPADNFYSSNVPGDRNSFYGAGTFNQSAAPYISADEIAAADLKKALRRKAEIKSYHMNDPFLFGGSLSKRLIRQAQSMQVQVPKNGLFSNVSRLNVPHQLLVHGPDKNEVLKVVKGESLLNTEGPYVEILSLLSLAAEERMRGLVEDAATLAKGRRIGSHGIVPVELTDLATGEGATETANGLPTPGSYAEINKPLTPSASEPTTPTTIQFANPVVQALQKITKDERAQEEERLAKRRRRAAKADTNGTGSPTPGSLGDIAPDVDTRKGNKNREAAAKKVNEAAQHAATTKTMNMALGFGSRATPSWMKKGADTSPSNPYLSNKTKAGPQSSKGGAPGMNGAGSGLPKSRVFGQFREDKETGSGIQLRDVVSVLEHDGKEKKALQRAYSRLGAAAGR
ncbi:MAG: hypothetical protein ASARMPREDX12_006518 [Alectoria sarmentosa]|nr:MAG: hypothetical protein ASARMPREDX12_006518 [Alectoria sarmentosa]